MKAASTEHAVKEFRRLVREANTGRAAMQARYAAVQARYDIACEIIANHIDGTHGSTDRARAMVEGQYRMRNGLVEEKVT